jgi:hypothetical protein
VPIKKDMDFQAEEIEVCFLFGIFLGILFPVHACIFVIFKSGMKILFDAECSRMLPEWQDRDLQSYLGRT